MLRVVPYVKTKLCILNGALFLFAFRLSLQAPNAAGAWMDGRTVGQSKSGCNRSRAVHYAANQIKVDQPCPLCYRKRPIAAPPTDSFRPTTSPASL
jgi:hypothetical protein